MPPTPALAATRTTTRSGIHVSDGDTSTKGLIGTKNPQPWTRDSRVFWTQQHGDNATWEIIRAPGRDGDDDGDRDERR